MPVHGDIVVADSRPAWAALPIGSANQILMSNGADPVWVSDLSVDSVLNAQIRNSMASVCLNANQTGIADNTWTKILLDAEWHDIGGNFASYKYTVPVSGYYQVHWAVDVYSSAGGDHISDAFSQLFLDGGEFGFWGSRYLGPAMSCYVSTGSAIIYMSATQYLELYVYATTNDASTITIVGSGPTRLHVALIST